MRKIRSLIEIVYTEIFKSALEMRGNRADAKRHATWALLRMVALYYALLIVLTMVYLPLREWFSRKGITWLFLICIVVLIVLMISVDFAEKWLNRSIQKHYNKNNILTYYAFIIGIPLFLLLAIIAGTLR